MAPPGCRLLAKFRGLPQHVGLLGEPDPWVRRTLTMHVAGGDSDVRFSEIEGSGTDRGAQQRRSGQEARNTSPRKQIPGRTRRAASVSA